LFTISLVKLNYKLKNKKMKPNNKVHNYKDEYYPPMPTGSTKFWRSCFIYQLYKFFVLNYKIMKMVVKGHS